MDFALEFEGQFTGCKVYSPAVEQMAVQQIYGFLNCPVFKGSQIRIMPDVHAGKGAVIGFTATLGTEVIPNVVGVDIGCFTGDTRVPLLSGQQATMKDLADKDQTFYVYSHDTPNWSFAAGKARALRTRLNAELVEVGISGGEVVRCTPDQKFLLISGEYVEARDLKPRMSLMPLYRSYQTRDGYETIHGYKTKARATHLMVDAYLNGTRDKDIDVHHVDGSWWNNDPSNLTRMGHVEHQRLHGKTTRNGRFQSESFKALKKETVRKRGWLFNPIHQEQRIATAKKNLPDPLDPTWRAKVTASNRHRAQTEVFVCHCGRTIRNKGNYTQHKRVCLENNHKVLWTRSLPEREDVYCLQVEGYHNFAISAGVIVHNCGVQSVALDHSQFQRNHPWFEKFDKMLRANVPSGFSIRNNHYPADRVQRLFRDFLCPTNVMGNPWAEFASEVEALATKIGADISKVWRSLGTLGGGNHYVEIGLDEEHTPWLTVHSGSRNFGLRVAEFHQGKAVARMGKRGGLEWLEGEDAQEYLRDMRIAQRYAMMNRLTMLDALLHNGFESRVQDTELVTSVHNFIGDDDVIRKGAISAHKGEQVIIPWNMRDGDIRGRGKGNADWNNSAPHGAGRKMARGKAKRELSLEEFRDTMKKANIWSSCIGKDTLDESPDAYKPYEEVLDCIGDTVEVEHIVTPVYNFKASGNE
jgi:tRNA-splicing ligase RtcB